MRVGLASLDVRHALEVGGGSWRWAFGPVPGFADHDARWGKLLPVCGPGWTRDDDGIQRFVIRHCRYDPQWRERHVVVGRVRHRGGCGCWSAWQLLGEFPEVTG